MSRVERVAVCAYDFPSLGDQLALLPLCDALRRLFPGCRLLAASRYERIRVVAETGFADEILVYRRAGWGLLRDVRRFAPQVSVCLRRSSPRANFCFGRGSGARRSVGYPGGGNAWMHTHIASYRDDLYRPRRILATIEPLGGGGDLPGTVRRLAETGTRDPAPGPYGVIVPAGAHDDKQWGAARFAGVAATLAAERPELSWYAILGPREIERGDAEVLAAALPGVEVIANAALGDLARVFLAARLVLANDCGPGHLALMGGAPLVQPFGNWDGEAPVRIGWWFDPRPGAVCVTTREPAPIGAIAEEAVLAAARELLADPRSGGEVRYAAT